jgi:hypothetical protein
MISPITTARNLASGACVVFTGNRKRTDIHKQTEIAKAYQRSAEVDARTAGGGIEQR